MAGENEGIDNPLSQGSNPHSVETAAADFSAMLADEGTERPRRREREKPASQSSEPEGEGDADERTERQPAKRERAEPSDDQDDRKDRRPERDPILDDGEPGEEDNGEDGEDDNPEDDPEEDDTEAEDDEDEADPEETFLEAKHKVRVNGQEVEVSGREALNGYMRQADYTQGAERNANEYREIEAYAAESVEHRQTALANIDKAIALAEALQPSKEDMEWLKANDPDKFIKATEHWNGILEKARGLLQARNQIAEQANSQSARKDAQYFETQERELLKKIPALRDPKKDEAFRSAIMEYGKNNGYTKEELIAGATDHRDLITLYKAAKYDEYQRSIKDAGKRAGQKAPKNAPESRARPPARNSRATQRNADRRHARSGTVQSAADSFAEMIRGEG